MECLFHYPHLRECDIFHNFGNMENVSNLHYKIQDKYLLSISSISMCMCVVYAYACTHIHTYAVTTVTAFSFSNLFTIIYSLGQIHVYLRIF